ncbi:MAG: TldD/PmbA family protein [Erysipelotrichaceae bacterium]|jgi:PmbA protein|nr:TldD/PmbA family protein [Erysipelotrichaceae bacterium]
MNNYNKFFALAKEKGISEAELYIYKDSSLSMGVFHSEMESVTASTDISIVARGVYKNKFGQASTSSFTKEKIPYLVDAIIANAKVIEKEEIASLFKGSEKYKKVNTYNASLKDVPIEKKKEDLFKLEKAILEADKRIIEATNIGYQESESELIMLNSHGLKLKQKNNSYAFVAAAVAKVGDEVKTGFDVLLDNDYSKVNIKKFASKVVEDTLDKLGGSPAESKKTKVVFAPSVIGSLAKIYIDSANAEEVQKHSSLFEGKLHKKVASSKVTISEKPLAKTIFARWFDDEGVATYNKDIIKKGILTTYLYNRETAKKDGVETTGNGYKAGGKIGSDTVTLFIKPGKKTQKELFEMVGEGVYITDLEGMNAGINSTSGNFSLKAEGFLIKDGKRDHPLALTTVSGNLLKLFEGIIALGNDVELRTNGVSAPSVVVNKLSVTGK